jgi:two-component system sensor histidine kinase/response regulator
MMGGDIRVESRPGKGATFSFDARLPRSEDRLAMRGRRRIVRVHPREQRRRVLVADDNAENRLLLAALLREVGFDVREAVNGREAVELAAEWRPVAIFMDERMPVMNGSEATQLIRNDERGTMNDECQSLSSHHVAQSSVHRSSFIVHRCIIIALTASAFEQQREAILANGCDDLVTKPFKEATIFEMLERHAGIEFEYETEDEGPADERSNGEDALDVAGRLHAVDSALVYRLREALTAGDAVEAEAAAAGIGAVDEPLAEILKRRIRAYEFDEVLIAVERVTTDRGTQ